MQYSHEAFLKELGARLKGMRRERGWTLRHMVVEHGFHLTHWQKFEGGKGISLASLLRVCEVFGVPLPKLVADLGEVLPDSEIEAGAKPVPAKTSAKPPDKRAKAPGQKAISRRISSASSTSQTGDVLSPESKTGTRRTTRASRQV
jgi:transcriptional regulator with XRE-family HTH domain